jgi:hypothetical protein
MSCVHSSACRKASDSSRAALNPDELRVYVRFAPRIASGRERDAPASRARQP